MSTSPLHFNTWLHFYILNGNRTIDGRCLKNKRKKTSSSLFFYSRDNLERNMDGRFMGSKVLELHWQRRRVKWIRKGPKEVKRISLGERKIKENLWPSNFFLQNESSTSERQKWFSRPTSNLIIYGLNCVYECPYL